MVSELGSGQPPSPATSLPLGAQLEATHPVGFVVVSHPPSPPAAATQPPPPSATLCTAAEKDQQQKQQPNAAVPMAPNAAAQQQQQALLSRGQSPVLSSRRMAVLKPVLAQLVSGFVPLSEMGSAATSVAPSASMQQQQQLSACPGSSEEEEPSSRPPDRPASATGYESGDDMDVLSMQHCTNCTGTLWGHICMDCGHMPAHDADIFEPTVASATALHRPRLQGDALTVLCWDERMELHEEAGSSVHPERPDRVRAVMARLQAAELAGRCRRLMAREATPAEVQACHIPELLEAVDVLSEQARLQGNAGLHFSPDTYVNQYTAMCAKLSAGACVDVTAAVVRGDARAGVAVVRPPGHHAESNTAMGFCFFNNAGIAARAAQAAGAERVLVLDWDVHHGNGTQHIFEADPSVLYMSLHRHDGGSFYPGTGGAHEVGEGAGEGYSVNVPWPCGGMRNGDYLAAFQHVVLPIAYEYAPDLVIISAGFDAAEGDPIGGCYLTPECYAHMTAQLQLVAPTVALLEGGYNLLSTAKGTEAVLRVLLGERPPQLPTSEQQPCEYGMGAMAQVMRIHSRYWDCMRGLVQQQFKVLAVAAARQEQLAAMKLRRQEAAGSAGHELELGGEEGEDGEEEAQLHRHRHHVAEGGAAEVLEETEADTPHQQYRGGSGWESDADLDSDEQLSQGNSDSEGEGAGERGGGEGDSGAASPHLYDSNASPLHLAPERLASDTAPISNSEAHGSGLTSGSLSPGAACDCASGAVTPTLEQSLDVLASARLPSEEETVPPLVKPKGDGEGGARDSHADTDTAAAAAHWKSLAVRPIVLKRASQPTHHRLSPALLDGATMQLLCPREQQQAATRSVPQQQQEP